MIRVLFFIAAFVAFIKSADGANLIARNSTGFTTATTWGVSETGASAEQLTHDNATFIGTSYTYSSTFTVTLNDSIEGVLVKIRRVNTTGTVTLTLSADSGTTPGQEVTVNASDLSAPTDELAWTFFKFGTPMTGLGTATYKVGIKASSDSNSVAGRDSTAGNFTRLLRTATTQVPVAADNFYIAGEWTAAATVTTLTVSLNETATTDYGQMLIGYYGIASAGTTASTNYNLKLSGMIYIQSGGILQLGTTGTPVPSTSTFKLNIDCGSNVQYGIHMYEGSTFIAQGASKTVSALLAADAAATATSLTTNVSTSWANGDEIGIASTTRTASQSEKKSLTAGASGTTLTIAAITNAHSGTSPTQAELINLTRNVQIFGASASLQTYILVSTTATIDWDYAEFYWLGSGTGSKRGIDLATTTGNVNIQYCSFHDFAVASSLSLYIPSLTSGTFNYEHNVLFSIANRFFWNEATTNTTWVYNDNIAIYQTDGGAQTGLYFGDFGGTVTSNTVVSAPSWCIQTADQHNPVAYSGMACHASGGGPQHNAFTVNQSWSNMKFWRNNSNGIRFEANSYVDLVLDGCVCFGNGGENLRFVGSWRTIKFNNLTMGGDTSFSTNYGIQFSNFNAGPIVLNNSVLGAATGIYVAHATADISISQQMYFTITGANTTLASTAPLAAHANTFYWTVGISKFGQVDGTNKTFILAGNNIYNTITTDSVIYHTASPSQRLTPVTTARKHQSSSKAVALNSGATTTVTAYVRKSASGDAGGADYNGAQPRLMVRTNPACGIGDGASDVVLDTMTVAVGNWEALTGTTGAVTANCILEAYVDLDGTAGWVNVDTWTMTNPQAVGAEGYWIYGGTNLTLSGNGAAVATTLAYPTVQ